MDPLTITTGVITILQATTTLISVCYDFRAALKNAPWSLTRVIEELKSLRNILESLEEHAQDLDQLVGSKKRPIFELLSDHESGPLAICLRELHVLDEKIGVSSYALAKGSKSAALVQALRWQLKDKDAKECLERIERCKTTLALALSGDQV
ncbi:hypothetical protein K469DRAFT_568733 [Zopfia rhizophila CBS 207.26]|uniref:Azaphilone pigments biosynthesis cluster protein L N-terminal domain-containing protein n=1 Tax=Zopfia rhizophila CBS 207.26 TaxID=1314779 RepID=A0A6A6ECN1_9PEZI|nr:hypothetical protein K469DRAFT_568733 [Zopfia rhizophila CBS 207.26]